MKTLQYPQPDRCACDMDRKANERALTFSCSILNRIDVPVTSESGTTTIFISVLQYPQPDRCACDQGSVSVLTFSWKLAVSSTGSMCL